MAPKLAKTYRACLWLAWCTVCQYWKCWPTFFITVAAEVSVGCGAVQVTLLVGVIVDKVLASVSHSNLAEESAEGVILIKSGADNCTCMLIILIIIALLVADFLI